MHCAYVYSPGSNSRGIRSAGSLRVSTSRAGAAHESTRTVSVLCVCLNKCESAYMLRRMDMRVCILVDVDMYEYADTIMCMNVRKSIHVSYVYTVWDVM